MSLSNRLACDAFWDVQARRTAPLCCWVSHAVAKPRLVALIAQLEQPGGPRASGFRVLHLPDVSDVRSLDYTELVATGTGTQPAVRADERQVLERKSQ